MQLNLINDMMDLAKSEQMKFILNNQIFDLKETIDRAIDNMAFLADEKKVIQNLIIDDKLLPFLKNIKGDEGRYI